MIKDKSIFIKNIYYMLSYAFTTLNQGGYEDVATEEFENIHNLFAAILAKGISRQLKEGLYTIMRAIKQMRLRKCCTAHRQQYADNCETPAQN